MSTRVSDVASRVARAAGGTGPGVWLIKNVLSPAQRIAYRRTRGRVSLTGGLPVLLLTTTGRRTGKARTVPLFYLRDDDRYVICNVRPPGERVNPWVINISADPDVLIEVAGSTLTARARPATEVELTSFWPELVAVWPAYQDFAAAGGKRSVFVLEQVRARSTTRVDDPGMSAEHEVGPLAELSPGSVVGAGGYAVGNVAGELFAVSRRCRHLGADLAGGSLDEQGRLVCPWHHAAYDVRTGRMVRGPQGAFARVPGLGAAYRALTRVLPLRRGEVVERDGCVFVR